MHTSRVKSFIDTYLGKDAALQEVAQFADRFWYSDDIVKAIRTHEENFQVHVSWKGLTTLGNFWEPLENMFEDVPTKVRAFFSKKRASEFVNCARASIGL